MVAPVSHKDIPIPIHCDPGEIFKLHIIGPVSISIAYFTSARQCGHLTLRWDLADTMGKLVSHDDVPAPIHCDSSGTSEPRYNPFSDTMPIFTSTC
jgi:hypothetical protein